MTKIKFSTLLALLLISSANAENYKPIYKFSTDDYNKNALVCCFIDWGASGWLSQSQKFPEAEVFDIASNKNVKISSLVTKRPIVIQAGSMTCPSYDLNIERIKKIQKKYAGKVDFYTLYVRENHPTALYPAHTKFDQKISFAKKLKTEGNVEQNFLVDDVNGSLHQALGSFGNSLYLVGKDMHINHWSIFPNSDKLVEAIESLLAANGVAQNAKYINGTDLHSILSPDFKQNEKLATAKKMKEREGQMNKEEMITEINNYFKYLEKNHPEVRGEFSSDEWKTMQTLSTYSMNHDMNNQNNKTTWTKQFKNVHTDFRNQYKNRYNKWKKINNLTIKDDVTAKTLLNESPLK